MRQKEPAPAATRERLEDLDLPFATWRDLSQLSFEAIGYLAAGVTPAPWDLTALKCARWIRRSSREREVRRVAGQMKVLLGPRRSADGWGAEAESYLDMRFEQELGRWRSLHRRAWQVETEVDRADRLLESISSGSGAVLWGMSFCGDLPVKVSLCRAGVPLVHLSTWQHGLRIPFTRLGVRTLGRLHVKAEGRYLADRIVIPPGNGVGYLRALIEQVRKGHCVFMSGVRTAPIGNLEVQIFDRSAVIAAGPPHLAWLTDARLFPVSVTRLGAGRYRTFVHPAIRRESGDDRRTFSCSAANTFAALLESRVRARPADWDWDCPWTKRLLATDEGEGHAP